MIPDTPHVLFVNPWIHDFAAYDFWAKPLGLLRLAAMAQKAGLQVSYADCLDRFHPRATARSTRHRFGRGPFLKQPLPKPPVLSDVPRTYSRYGIPPQWFKADMAALPRPDLIAVTSSMTYWYPGVQETIDCLRDLFPHTPLIMGGAYATLCPEHAGNRPGIDAAYSGPGEMAVFEALGTFTGWHSKLSASGIDMENFDTYPMPAWDLQRRIEYVPLLTTAGCPYQCPYCASYLLHPRMMRRNPGAVVEEVDYWHRRFGVRDFVLYDDAFLFQSDIHAVPLLERIAEKGLPVRFHTPNAVHVRWLTKHVAQLLRRCRFQTLRLGLETIHSNGRMPVDLKTTHHEFKTAAANLKAAGFSTKQVGVYLLAGLPGQALSVVETAVDQVKLCGLTPVIAYYSPIPRTRLWQRALAASRYDLAAEPVCTNNAILPCQKKPFSWDTVSRLKQRAAR